MASLIITNGKKAGKFYPLGRRTNVVGRDEGVLIQIVDEYVSRKHLQIRYQDDTGLYYANDMKSRHGTYVNGNRIYDEVPLTDGDLVDIGGVTLMFASQDFEDPQGALAYYRETGQRVRGTLQD